jgi:dihydroorotase
MNILIRNAQLFLRDTFIKSDLLLENGKIAQIAPLIEVDGTVEVIEAKGLFCSPGLVDLHAHLREPGFEYRETIESGLAAAGLPPPSLLSLIR